MTTIDETSRAECLGQLVDEASYLPWSQRDMHLVSVAETVLYVEDGLVDLFAVTVDDGGHPTGPWHSLARLAPGDVITGPVAGPKHRMLMRRVGQARVRSISMRDLRRRLIARADDEHAGATRRLQAAMATGMESALRKLEQAVQRNLPPRDFEVLPVGATCQFSVGDVLRPVDGLAWVEVVSGDLVQGQASFEHSAGSYFCVGRQDWLRLSSKDALLRTYDTQSLVESGEIWPLIVEHWSRYLYQIDRSVERAARAAEAQVRSARRRDEQTAGAIRDANDDLLLHESVSRPLHGLSGTLLRHTEAVLRVLEAQAEDTTVPPSLAQRRDIADFECLGASGWVRTRTIRLEGQWWLTDMGPVVGYWGPDHRPVAYLFSAGGYVAHADWLDNPVRVTKDNHYSAGRQVWEVHARLPGTVRSVGSLLRYAITGRRGDLALFGAMAVLVGALSLLTPILNGTVLGSYVASANRPMIVQAGLAVMLAAVVSGAFSVVQNLAVLRLQGSATVRSQTGVFSRLLDLPVGFFHRYSTGRLGTIVLSLKAAQELLSGVVVTATLGLVVVVANLVLIFFYSASLALVAVVLVAVAVGACVVAGRAVLAQERLRYDAEQRLNGMGFEIFSAMSKVRAAAAEERAFQRWSQQQRVVQSHALRSRRVQDRVTAFNAVYPIVALALLFTLANLRSEPLPLPALLSFLTAFTLLMNSLLQFTGSVLTAGAIVPMIESLRPLLSEDEESGIGRAHPGELSGTVSLRGVSFRYSTDSPLVLDDISMDIRPGEFVAIVGPSGGGKSSIIRLLLGFARPEQGAVLYDGQDLRELDLPAVRRQCGVVLQSGSLMPGDIRENISGGGRYSEDEIWEAADMAGLTSVIKAMPMGLGTVLSESGGTISGGQAQRLMIARALVNRPRFVIFDEATSALDNPTQQVVAEATRQLNATRIVVAHRLSTIRSADRILVVDQGRIVQEGTYDELAADHEGLFAGLAREQQDE